MKTSRAFLLVALLAIAVGLSWYWSTHRSNSAGGHITVYYTKDDGSTEVPWTVSMRAQLPGESDSEHRKNVVLYAATQAAAGPPSDVSAIRFPPGTHILSADVNDSTATVDLSGEVRDLASSVLGETGAFKALVWTLTAIPGIDRVVVRVQGATLSTLPGGHVELDEPLRRSDW